MARAELRTRTRREMMPRVSPAVIAAGILLAEFAAFALTAGQASMVIRSFLVALPLIVFIARAPVVGIYAVAFFIPLEVFARIPDEFFSLYKLLGVLTLTSTLVHAVAGESPSVARQRTAVTRWMFVFLFLMAASVLWSIEPALSLQSVRRLVTLAVFYFLVVRLVDSQSKLRILMLVMVASAVVAGLFAVTAFVRGDAVFDTQSDVTVEGSLRAAGASLDANFFAATILASLPACLLLFREEKQPLVRAGLAVAALVIVLGTVFSFSRGGALTLMLIVGLAFMSLVRRLEGRALLATLGVGLLAMMVGFAVLPASYKERVQSLQSPMEGDESIRGRWLYVQYGGEAVLESPLGVGAGAFPVAFRQSRYDQMYRYYDLETGQEKGRSAHNMYLEVSVESGLLGGALFTGMIVFALYESRRTGRHLRRKGEPWLRAANESASMGLVSFAFAGLFLSAQYEKTLWLLVALIPVTKNLAWEGEVFVPDLKKLRRALARRER
jgi:O-antigen ligase